MKLSRAVREQFRRYGRAGGRKRAARLGSEAKSAIARRAAAARWIGARFGALRFESLGLPGGEIVDTGLSDLAAGRVTVPSLLVSLAAPRLRRDGIPVGVALVNPEDRLYKLLRRTEGGLAHARYGAYRRQMASFADACRAARRDRKVRAS
jgi:hypothetical protein